MELLDKIQTYLNTMDQKRFYQYMIGTLSIIVIILALLLFQYYRTISSLKAQAAAVNELREDEQRILDKAQRIKKDQKEINAVLAQDPNFKIGAYFQDLLEKQGLAQKKPSIGLSKASPEGNYQESVLQAQFTSLTMKELTELLQEIELNKRVFIKELDIRAKKETNSIDATLIIATLVPKQQETGDSTE